MVSLGKLLTVAKIKFLIDAESVQAGSGTRKENTKRPIVARNAVRTFHQV